MTSDSKKEIYTDAAVADCDDSHKKRKEFDSSTRRSDKTADGGAAKSDNSVDKSATDRRTTAESAADPHDASPGSDK